MSADMKKASPQPALVSRGRICASVQLHPVPDVLAHPVISAFFNARRAL